MRALVGRTLLVTLLCSVGVISRAGELEETIAYLLNFVAQSDCVFIRNGSEHTSVAAAAHIEKKYHYYEDRITTANQFIELAATRSSLTGELYLVRCPGRQAVPTSDWLADELEVLSGRHALKQTEPPEP